MGLFGFGRKKSVQSAENDRGTSVIDVTADSVVEVNLSIHDTPGHLDRIGEALCMVTGGARIHDSSGAVVPILRHPNRVTRTEFAHLLEVAAQDGHLEDGFFEVVATIDIDTGNVIWQPENGPGVQIPQLDAVVENALYSLSETNLFGEWFTFKSVSRASLSLPETGGELPYAEI